MHNLKLTNEHKSTILSLQQIYHANSIAVTENVESRNVLLINKNKILDMICYLYCMGISVKVKPIDLYFAYMVNGLIFTAAKFMEKANMNMTVSMMN